MNASGRKPRVVFDGVTYCVRSARTPIPDLAAMSRIEALVWLNRNTHARGTNFRKPSPNLRGLRVLLADPAMEQTT